MTLEGKTTVPGAGAGAKTFNRLLRGTIKITVSEGN